MHYMIIRLVLLAVAIGCFTGTYFEVKNLHYTDADTDKKCTYIHNTNLKEGDKCGAWDGVQCRRGTVVGGMCVSKGNILPLILLITGVICFVAFIVFMILAVIHRHDIR